MSVVRVLTTKLRQGTMLSASVTLPNTITGSVTIAAAGLSDANLANPLNIMRLHAFTSTDGGASWVYQGGGAWQGGSTNKDGSWNRPAITVNEVERLRGCLVRIEVDMPVALRCGAEVIYT